MSKNGNICVIILLCILSVYSNTLKNKFQSNKLQLSSRDSEFTSFSYRSKNYLKLALLFENVDARVTQIKPDDDSRPLRVSKEELGRFTWYTKLYNANRTFLHSVAAAYPKEPTLEEKQAFRNLMNSIPFMYPCKDCANHFGLLLKENPIVDTDREAVVLYVCGLHNLVNKRLGKPIFDCKKAFGFWGGDCGCSGN
jgi:FAD-linked sulfhydryl oxidase